MADFFSETADWEDAHRGARQRMQITTMDGKVLARENFLREQSTIMIHLLEKVPALQAGRQELPLWFAESILRPAICGDCSHLSVVFLVESF
jgi:hypothetical protein